MIRRELERRHLVAIAMWVAAAVIVAAAIPYAVRLWNDPGEGAAYGPTPPTETAPVPTDTAPAPAEMGLLAGPSGRMVRGEDLKLHHPGGAELRIAAGTLPADAGVALRTTEADALALLGTAQASETAWLIDAADEPTRPVELTLPYEPDRLRSDARPLVAMYDGLSGLWLPVETTADEAAGLLTASVPNFSLTTVITDRVQNATGRVSWLEHQSWDVRGGRGDPPECLSNPRPDWVSPVEVRPGDGWLHACVGRAGDGFAIHLANRFGFPVDVAFDRPFLFAQPNGLEPELIRHAGQLVAASGRGRLTLLPAGTAAVVYDPLSSTSGHVTGYVRRDAGAMLSFLAYELGERAGTEVLLSDGRTIGETVRECHGRTFTDTSELATLDLATAGDELTGCLTDVLPREMRRRGFDPDAGGGSVLWSRDVESSGPEVQGLAASLRLLRALDAGQWTQTAVDLLDLGDPVTGLAMVSVRWEGAP